MAIILNPAGPDHAGPITGVATDQDKTIINTAAAGKEVEYNAPTGVA